MAATERPHEYPSIFVHDFFTTVISAHNEQVSESRQFTVGNITVENKKVYRTLRYESTFDVLKRQCLNAEGGYFFIRREDGVNYIDWLAEMPYTTNQPVEFGLNLLDITSGFNGSSIVTCVLPLGETDKETGEELTIASVNNGSDVIDSEAAETYGRITKAVQFNGVRYPDTLYEDGLEYLASRQFDGLLIECSAAELHFQNPNYEKFRVGQTVRCHSIPHLMDRTFPLLKMSISLDSAAKKITLGSQKKQTLTEITKFDSESALADMEDKLDTAIGEIKPEIDAIKGIPDPDDFKSILDEYDWRKHFPDDTVPDDLDDLLNRFKDSPSLPDMQDTLAEFQNKLKDYETDFGDDFDSLKSLLDSLNNDIGIAENPKSSYEMSQAIGDLSSTVNGVGDQITGISSSITDMGTQISGLSSQVDALSNQPSGTQWTFQINGQTVESGTANFVT